MRIVILARRHLALLIAGALATADAQTVPRQPRPPIQPGPIAGAEKFNVITLTAPVVAAPTYSGVRTSAGIRVVGAKDGTTIGVKPILPAAGCAFVTLQPVPITTATVRGATTVTVPGMFVDAINANATTCSFSAEVTATKPDGATITTVVRSSSVALTPLTTYVVANTADWISKFAFSNTSARGDCTGSSNGPNGIFRVGLVTSESGQANVDLTFKIRSGPTGTHCKWTSQPILLPEGMRLTSIELLQDASGPCRTTPSVLPPGVGGFSSSRNPVTFGGSVVSANPLGAGYPVFGIVALNLSLDCDNTASNDRFATLVIKSLTFVGPPNLAGFP